MATSNAVKHIAYKPKTIYRDLLPAEEKKPKKIVSVWPEDITLPHYALGTHVTIPGFLSEGNRGGRWNYVEVPSGVERDDMGEVKTLAMRSISARRVAMDVLGLADEGRDEVTGAVLCPAVTTSQLFERGYFVPAGDDPTEAELRAAEERREKYLDIAIARGDRAWEAGGKDWTKVPGEAIIAAKLRNLTDREWARGIKQRRDILECPACGSEMKRGREVCPNCTRTVAYEEDGTAYWPDSPSRKAAQAKAAAAQAKAAAKAEAR